MDSVFGLPTTDAWDSSAADGKSSMRGESSALEGCAMGCNVEMARARVNHRSLIVRSNLVGRARRVVADCMFCPATRADGRIRSRA